MNCFFCKKNYKNEQTLNSHIRQNHYEDAIKCGRIKPQKRKRKHETINDEEIIQPDIIPSIGHQSSEMSIDLIAENNINPPVNILKQSNEMVYQMALENFQQAKKEYNELSSVGNLWLELFNKSNEIQNSPEFNKEQKIKNFEEELIKSQYYSAGLFLMIQELKK